jgi:DNA-binding transcriptional MerR regulator
MLSVGRFAKLAKVSARTVRYYESIGLLPSPVRRENNYRFYDQQLLERMERIRDLQSLGFGLEEIKEAISFSNSELRLCLQKRLSEVDDELESLGNCRSRLVDLLSVATKIESGESITETERNLYMEAIRGEIIKSLEKKYAKVTDMELEYLSRDSWFYTHPEMGEFIEALKKCVEFAKSKNLLLGPGRGSAPASITIFGVGFSSIDPMKYEMIPERLSTQPPSIHIDVEFERGQEFVDYCREVNKKLKFGEIQAFKMPLIDIVKNVHLSIGSAIDYSQISDDSDVVLKHFRCGEIDRIFSFDFSDKALVMKYENFLPGYSGLEKMKEYLRGQEIRDFRDVINITALWRPHSIEIIERLESYRQAKGEGFKYNFLAKELQASLEPNFGRVVYHEDLLRIVSHYTGWGLGKCNSLRKTANKCELEVDSDWAEFRRMAPNAVADLVQEESKWAFCMPHAIAFAQFTKQTAVLKSLHRGAYFAEIEKFEQKHGLAWDDIGIRFKGVSLLQN